jgi:flagellar FliL protein
MATVTDKSTTKPKDVSEAAAAPTKKKKSKKKLIIIAVVVLLVAGVGYKKFMAPAKKPLTAAAAAAAAAVPAKPGPLVAPDAVTVNLTGGHYLRIGIALQFTVKSSKTAPPDGSAALDQVITYLTGQNATSLETPAGLASVKAALTTRIAKVYPDDPLLEVLFTSFVIQ